MSLKFYSDVFNINEKSLNKYDVFNGYSDKDALYYVVPSKLENINIIEFKNSYNKYKSFFEDIISILDKSNGEDILFRKVHKKYQLKEMGDIGLGYSENNKKGSGIGSGLALKLAKTSLELVEAGIKDPEIFQLVGLLESGIGADRISDITIAILIEDFLKYTDSASLKLKIPTKAFGYNKKIYQVPYYNKNYIIFCPKSILTRLPVAFDREDIANVCSHNETLRAKTNKIIANSFTKVSKKKFKNNLKKLIIQNPKIVKDIIKSYKDKSIIYDFEKDPSGDFIWKSIANNTAKDFPLDIKEDDPVKIVKIICRKYQSLIENNGLWKFFHNADGTFKKEFFGQMLFFAISNSYCEANNIDLSPEVNSGGGAVDFKMSRGAKIKINVEMKLSTNTKLLDGYKKQLPTYNKAENTKNSFFVIILLDNRHTNKIEKVLEYKKQNQTVKNRSPEIFIINATYKKSASKI